MIILVREIVKRRNLIAELIVKEFKLRYHRSSLGILWVLLSPLATVAILYLVFSVFLKVRIEEVNFLLYLMTVIFSWRFFSDSLLFSTSSLVDSRHLIKEANFPHYFIPLAIVLSNAIILLVSFILVAISALFMGQLSVWVFILPLVMVLHLMLTLGLCVIFSVVYVRYRDIKHLLEVLLLLLFYMTPAFYSFSLVSEALSPALFKVYAYNPLVAILTLYRVVCLKGFYGAIHADFNLVFGVAVVIIFCLLTLLLGVYIFKKNRRHINDFLSY